MTSNDGCLRHRQPRRKAIRFQLAGQSLLITGLPLLRRILGQGSPLIEAGLIDPDGLKAAVTELENGPRTEDPWSKLVEVITLDQRHGRSFPEPRTEPRRQVKPLGLTRQHVRCSSRTRAKPWAWL